MLRFAGRNALAQVTEATKTPGLLSTRDLVSGARIPPETVGLAVMEGTSLWFASIPTRARPRKFRRLDKACLPRSSVPIDPFRGPLHVDAGFIAISMDMGFKEATRRPVRR